jgi:hypothetical protein
MAKLNTILADLLVSLRAVCVVVATTIYSSTQDDQIYRMHCVRSPEISIASIVVPSLASWGQLLWSPPASKMPHSTCLAICWVFLAFGAFSASFVPSVSDDNYKSGTFEHPNSRSRPRFRYWLPDASVDGSIVAADIKSAGSIGAGGVEFLLFFNYGGDHGPQPKGANWSSFAFGSPSYRDLLVDALKSHSQLDLYMDIAIGPNQGQGVPANADDEGLQWDLVSRALSRGTQIPGLIYISDPVHRICRLQRILQQPHSWLERGKR